MLAHLARNISEDFGLLLIGQADFEHRVWKCFHYNRFHREFVVLLGHKVVSSPVDLVESSHCEKLSVGIRIGLIMR